MKQIAVITSHHHICAPFFYCKQIMSGKNFYLIAGLIEQENAVLHLSGTIIDE